MLPDQIEYRPKLHLLTIDPDLVGSLECRIHVALEEELADVVA